MLRCLVAQPWPSMPEQVGPAQRERERADRVNITTYYTVTTSLASAAQQHTQNYK